MIAVVSGEAGATEARRRDCRRKNVPLCRNRSFGQHIWIWLPVRYVLIVVAQLRRIRWLIDHWISSLTVISSRAIPLIREVICVFYATTLQWIFERWRIAVVRRMFAIVFAAVTEQASAALMTTSILASAGRATISRRAITCTESRIRSACTNHPVLTGTGLLDSRWLANIGPATTVRDSDDTGGIGRRLCECHRRHA